MKKHGLDVGGLGKVIDILSQRKTLDKNIVTMF